MSSYYTEFELLEISKKQYDSHEVGDDFVISKNSKKIGYVSEINDKVSGEQSYVITDIQLPSHPTPEDLAKVKTVTVLYRGSTAPTDIFNEALHHNNEALKQKIANDFYVDWFENDLPMAERIITNNQKERTQQLKDASKTLQEVLKKYPNAQIDIHGHSLGLMNGQSALADVKPEDARRIRSAYFFNGPNIYNVLTDKEHQNINRMFHKIHIYIDTNDFVGLGYDTSNVLGNVYRIKTKSKGLLGMIDQHMWGGYEIDAYGNFIHADGSLVSSDIRLKHVDIDGDGVIDIKLDTFDARIRNLVSKDLTLVTSSQKIQVNTELLKTLAHHLTYTIQTDISEMKKMIQLCIKKNETVTSSFATRKEKITESIQDVFKRSGMSYLLEDLYASVGTIINNKMLLEKATQYTELQENHFNNHQTPMVHGDRLNFTFYNTQLATLRYACEPLLERVNQERTGNIVSYLFGYTPTVLKSWEVIEKATQTLLKSSDAIFEGEGLRESKVDGISDSLTIVLNVILQNTDEIQSTLNHITQLISGIAINFEQADKWIGQKLAVGEFSGYFKGGVMPSSYKAYLERDAIFDDVKDVLQAFDRQVEIRSSEYAKKVAEVYQETLGKFEEGLKDWLSFGETFKKTLNTVMDNYSTDVYVKQRQITYESMDNSVVEKETYPITYWGKLEQLYPHDTKSNTQELKTSIVPTFDRIQQTLWRSQNTKDQLGHLETQLKPIIEDGVYHAFDLDEIVKGQKMVSSIATRLGKEMQHVINVIDGDGMQAKAITTLKQKLAETRQLIAFYTQFINDCFGDNENSSYITQSDGGNHNRTFTLN